MPFCHGMEERPRDTHRVERCVCFEREGGMDLNNEMGAHVYVIGKELSRW